MKMVKFILVRFYGYATKTITSGSMHSNYKKDMVYFFVNKRPVNVNKKFTTLLSQIYKQYNPGAKYIVILSISLPSSIILIILMNFLDEFDINVTPDKREIVFKNPQSVYDCMKKCFEEFHEKVRSSSKLVVRNSR
jgi:DNA mismatch repair ATPase MutL